MLFELESVQMFWLLISSGGWICKIICIFFLKKARTGVDNQSKTRGRCGHMRKLSETDVQVLTQSIQKNLKL